MLCSSVGDVAETGEVSVAECDEEVGETSGVSLLSLAEAEADLR